MKELKKKTKYEINKEYAKAYLKYKVEEFKVRVPIGQKDRYKKMAKSKDMSLNDFAIKSMEYINHHNITKTELDSLYENSFKNKQQK